MSTGKGLLVLVAGLVVVAGLSAAYRLPRWISSDAATSPVSTAAQPPSSVSPEVKKVIQSKIAESKSGKVSQAVFGAGCFWGVEAAFRRTPGVLLTEVGYAGGSVLNPTYEQVCTDTTGHAEVVRVEFDPEEISFEKLLDVFFENHNPTQLNRQGPDFGKQYRTVVFYTDEAQKTAAETAKEKLAASGKFKQPVVTQIVPLINYFPAEGYHQQYLEKKGLTHCHL
jgi:peptide-methionine (S)-S-oxide reductase